MFRIKNYNKKESQIKSIFFENNSENTIIGKNLESLILLNNGEYKFNWVIPYDFKEFSCKGGIYLVCIPYFNDNISKYNISMYTNYDNGPNSKHDYYSEYDTSIQNNFSKNFNNVIHIPFENILTNIKPLSTGSIIVKHNDVNGIIHYLGINLVYRRKN